VKALLDSRATGLVMSSKFARRKRIEMLIYIENEDGTFNKKKPIEHTVKVNIYYQGHKERMEIDVIGGQKWNIILEILWLAYHNPEINSKTEEVKMTRCLDECRKK